MLVPAMIICSLVALILTVLMVPAFRLIDDGDGAHGNSIYSGERVPPKRARTALNRNEKIMLLNVWNYIRDLFPNDTVNGIGKRTEDATRIGLTTINKTRKEMRDTDTLSSPSKTGPKEKNKRLNRYDSFTLSCIRRKVHQFFARNEPPTLNKVLNTVNEDPDLPNMSKETLRRILHDIGFKYKKRGRNSMLIERNDLILWRIRYLRDISRYRAEGRNIFYLDETWCNAGHSVSWAWQDTCIKDKKSAFLAGLTTGLKEHNKGGRITLLHVGNEHGFVDGAELICGSTVKDSGELPCDPHRDMTGEKFEKWFSDILLPKLPPNSVIVMDNASYHSRQSNRAPTSNSRKEAMRIWLTEHNISWTNDMLKAQLYEIIKLHKDYYKTYIVDEAATAKGHVVLRLPPYHCDINPIEMVWNQVKSHVAHHNTSGKLNDIPGLLRRGIGLVTAEQWSNYCRKVLDIERQMKVADGIMDEVTERFIISIGQENDSDTDDESDSSGLDDLEHDF